MTVRQLIHKQFEKLDKKLDDIRIIFKLNKLEPVEFKLEELLLLNELELLEKKLEELRLRKLKEIDRKNEKR